MKILVLGSGLMGTAAAYDLVHNGSADAVILADIDAQKVEASKQFINSDKVTTVQVDVTNPSQVQELMQGCDAVISAVTYKFNYELAQAAVAAGAHFCDLGGNNTIVDKELSLHDKAVAADVTIVPDCGLAPGMVAVLAKDAAEWLDTMTHLHLRVGGLPKNPQPPLNYKMVFSPSGLINEYIEPVVVVRDGKKQIIDPMIEVEELSFPEPFGTLEAFTTSGGTSTLPETYTDVQHMDYKTIRYPGHCAMFKMMLDIGMFSEEPLTIRGETVVPRDVNEQVLVHNLTNDDTDVVLVRVVAKGTKDGTQRTRTYTIIDYHDEKTNLSAMMRMTAMPISIVAQMLASGEIQERGGQPQERCVPASRFIEELRKRNVTIDIKDE